MRKPILYARLSDNVLDPEDWPIVKLVIEGHEVVATELVNRGCYDMTGMPAVGWTTQQIMKWTDYDSTGSHPENYHMIRPEHDEKWVDFVSEKEMRRMLSGESMNLKHNLMSTKDIGYETYFRNK